jgi:hypothetical protein
MSIDIWRDLIVISPRQIKDDAAEQTLTDYAVDGISERTGFTARNIGDIAESMERDGIPPDSVRRSLHDNYRTGGRG